MLIKTYIYADGDLLHDSCLMHHRWPHNNDWRNYFPKWFLLQVHVPIDRNTKVEMLPFFSLLTTTLLHTRTVALLERSLEHHDNPQIYKHCVWKKGKRALLRYIQFFKVQANESLVKGSNNVPGM